MTEEKKNRDTDLTIWSFVFFILSIGDIVVAVALFSGRAYERFMTDMAPMISAFFTDIGFTPSWWPPTPTFFILLGIGAVIWGAVMFLIGYGVYTMKSWARTLAIIAGFLLLPVAGLGIIMLWYFFRTETKEAFK